MSVAFRRESDDEHMEPKFELPIPVGPNWVTQRGARLLAERLAALEAELPTLTDEEQRKKLMTKIRYFGTRKATAEVQPAPADNIVGIGSRVTFALDGKERSLTIVGHDEAEPNEGLIAFTAPLGRALMNAEVEDFVTFQGREDAIEILSASADPKVQA
jgi:transcription elongation GreA/GreB family factor